MNVEKKFSGRSLITYDWLPKLDLERIDSDNGRKYRTPEGNLYPSVTTFLGSFGGEYLDEWRARVGEKEASRISTYASRRGTKLHESAEHYLLGKEITYPKSDLIGVDLFNRIKKVLDRIDNVRALESYLYSDNLNLAGTVDCVADFDGVTSIIDFKTSTRLKDKNMIDGYFHQCALYSLMVEERFGIKINSLVVVIANEMIPSSVYVDDRKKWLPELAGMIKEYRRNNG